MTSEVEFQRQLALGSSASNLEFHGDDPENDQISAATRLSLGGHRRGDAARKKDEVSGKTQSRQYWEYDVIDYDEKVVDGFYDAYGISTDSRLQGEMPSLTDLQTNPGSSSGFEAVVVNRKFDHALEELMQIAHCIRLDSPATEVTDLVQRLAELVTGHMGSPVEDANVMWARWMKRSTELRTSLQTNVLPIGSINVGLSRHRALLFKVLADSINLPCLLLKSRHYTGHAANLIKLDDERVFLVDLMASPGWKLPSLRSPNDLGVVHPGPKPLAGKGSSQSSNVDRSSSSKTSESFPAFPFASHDPGVGSSRVSGGTAQQLTVNVVRQSKKSSEDPTNLFADLNPFAIKGFPKVPMEGNSTEIKINEIPRQKPTVRLMPKNRHPHNEVPRKKDYGLKEGLFPRGNREASAYNVSSSIGSSTTDRVNPDRISVRKGQQLNIIVVPQSKNGSEDPTNRFADLNPAAIKGFRKAPIDGECTEIKINERLRQENNPVVPLMPKNRDPLNEVSRTNDCGFKDRLFPRSNREPDAYDVSSFIGSSMTDKVNPDSFKLSNNLNRSTQVSSGIKLPNKSNQLIKKSSYWNPFMDNNPILGRSTGQSDMMPHEERLNFQVREDPLRTPENLQDGIADSQRGRDRHEIGLLDPKKCTNDKFMDKVLDDVDVSEEIQWEHLVIGKRIGLGSSGEVYRADWNGTEVAVKKFLNQDFSGAALNEFRQEVRIMRRLRHPNVVRFMGAVARPPHLSIVTEFVPRGSLYRIIHRSCQIGEKRRINMALDVARGMNCLHTRVPTIVHRDLKSPNLLVDINWNVKVCDFGLSRLKPNTFLSSKSTAGTPQWMAPEVLCNEPSNEKCDVYSFGVILWELATLRLPWTGMHPMQVVGAVGFQNLRLDIPEEVHPLVRKIILECWQTEPNLRPSFAELTVFLKSLQRLVIPSHLDQPNSHLAGDQPNSSLSLEIQILGNKFQFSWPDILDTMRSLASEKDRITLGFQLLCVIMNDWISTLPAEFLPVFIDVIGAYSAQKTDLNISLTAIGFLWTAADIIAQGLSQKPSKEKESEAGRGDVQYIPRSVDGEESLDETCVASGRENDEASSKSTEDHDKLLFSVFMLLQKLGADERPEVRNSAVRTLFQTLGSHGQKPSKSMWEDCLRNYVFPMLNHASLMAATSSKDKWRGKELGTRGGKVVHMLTHHSCNTAQKQLDETLVLVLNGIYRILQSFFPFLKRLSNFWSGWEYLLIIVKDGILNGSEEVALAAVRSLQKTIVSHSRKGNLPMPYLTSVLEVYEFVFQRSPSNGINSTRKAKQKILHGLGELYVQAPNMFDSQMYTQLLAIIDLAIKQSMMGSENVETEIGNICIQRTVLEILPLLQPTEKFSSLWLILLREILCYLPQPDESLQNEEEEVKRTNAPDGSQDVRAKTRNETPNGIASTSLSKAELDSHSSKTKPMCISSNVFQEKVIPLLVDLSLQTPTVEKHIILPEIVESLGRCVTSRRDNPDAVLWRTAVEGFNRIVLDDVSRLKMNSGPDASISGEARARFWKEVADVYEAFLVGCCGRALPTDYLPAAAVKADESLEMTVLNILGDNVLRSPIDASANILQRLVSTLDRCASRTFTLPIDTVEPMPLHSSRFSLTCLEKLFSLTSYDSEACNGSSITSNISKISIMVLMARCEYILNRFLIDENDFGERPLPAARLEEMIYVLQQLACLVIHKETVCELPLHPHLRRGLGADDGHNRRAHLLVLFPSFCELVASRESRVRELVQVLLRLIAKELALGKFQALTGLK